MTNNWYFWIGNGFDYMAKSNLFKQLFDLVIVWYLVFLFRLLLRVISLLIKFLKYLLVSIICCVHSFLIKYCFKLLYFFKNWGSYNLFLLHPIILNILFPFPKRCFGRRLIKVKMDINSWKLKWQSLSNMSF